jgi:hypothetical protein
LIPPPINEGLPGQSLRAKRTVVDKAVIGVFDDLDHVVNRIAEHDARLRTVGGENQVLQLAVHAGHTKPGQVLL